MKRNQDDAIYIAWLVLSAFIAAACLMLISSCASPEVLRERPIIEIYQIQGNALWRQQTRPPMMKAIGLAEGWLCLSPEHMEKLITSCSEPYTIPAR